MNNQEVARSVELLAHKIKNPMHSALINLDVVKVKLQKLSTDRKTLRHVEIAISEVQRVNKILLRYLEYLGLDDVEREKTNLGDYLK